MFEKTSPDTVIMDFRVRMEVKTNQADQLDVSAAIQDYLSDFVLPDKNFAGGDVVRTQGYWQSVGPYFNEDSVILGILDQPDITEDQRRQQLTALGNGAFNVLMPESLQEPRDELRSATLTELARLYPDLDKHVKQQDADIVEWGKATILP